MAEISKITLPDGNTYDIKDTVARTNGKVSGVKGNSESSYRTGNVNLTANNIGAVASNDVLMTTNPFAASRNKSLYISKIDNAFYAANKRWNIYGDIDGTALSTQQIQALFDGSYETQMAITDGKTLTLTMDFSNESSGCFPGYPYGYIYLSFYHIAKPANVTARMYCLYATHGVGWHNLAVENYTSIQGSSGNIWRIRQPYYQMKTLEITIEGDTTNSRGRTQLVEIEMHLDRPDPSRNPFLSKYKNEVLYYNLTAPKFIGVLQGNADTATNASKVNNHTVNSDVPANANFTDTVTTATTTGSGNAVTAISASNGALTINKDTTFATKQESSNHVIASKTEPLNQQAGDIWMIIK